MVDRKAFGGVAIGDGLGHRFSRFDAWFLEEMIGSGKRAGSARLGVRPVLCARLELLSKEFLNVASPAAPRPIQFFP